MKTISEALIYESQGFRDDAIKILNDILLAQPDNAKAIFHLKRLNKKEAKLNETMLDLFLNIKSQEEIKEFKRWLVKL